MCLAAPSAKAADPHPRDLYLASRDEMRLVLRRLDELPASRGGSFVGIVGGLASLNFIARLEPATILLVDLNPAQVAYGRCVVELIKRAPSRAAFVAALFSRPFIAAVAAFPLVGGAMGWLAAPHQPKEDPIVFNPDGTALLVDAIPTDATPIDATFGDTVNLVAARFGEPDAEGNLHGELWFRITGPVPRSIGIFVHVFDGDRRIAQGDREVIGGTYFFANAPKNQLIRHAFAVKTGPAPTPMTWRIDVGLFQVYGDQSRVEVTRVPDARRGPDNRVIVRP
jgi:hypothetical protein